MPAASEVVVQYETYYAFAFNLDITRPCFERTPDFTVVTGSNAIVSRGLIRTPAKDPNQGKRDNGCDVDPFDRNVPALMLSNASRPRCVMISPSTISANAGCSHEAVQRYA
jgi:hypothetical protein